ASDGSDAVFIVAPSCNGPVMATRVHRDGSADLPIAVAPGGTNTASPRVAWNGSEFLVVWSQLDATYRAEIRAARVSPSMTVLDPQPLSLEVGNDSDFTPLVASDGRDFIVAWTVGAGGAVRVRGVSAGGTLGNVTALGPGTASSLAWTGHDFALAYSTSAGRALVRHLGGCAVLRVPASADETFAPTLAVLNGVLLAAYDRTASEPVYGSVPRVFIKPAGMSPHGRPVRAH